MPKTSQKNNQGYDEGCNLQIDERGVFLLYSQSISCRQIKLRGSYKIHPTRNELGLYNVYPTRWSIKWMVTSSFIQLLLKLPNRHKCEIFIIIRYQTSIRIAIECNISKDNVFIQQGTFSTTTTKRWINQYVLTITMTQTVSSNSRI